MRWARRRAPRHNRRIARFAERHRTPLGTTTKSAAEKKSVVIEAPAPRSELRGEPLRPQFRTVLVPSVGWPTEASLPSARKRSAKR